MSNIFSTNRFGRYLCHEIRLAVNNYGVSALLVGLMPLLSFMLFELFSFVTMHGQLVSAGLGLKIPCLFCSLAVYIVAGPAKLYGRLTDKRSGSSYLLLPASRLEKYLSMLIVTAVVVPFAISCLYVLSDLCLSHIFPTLYGESMITGALASFVDTLTNNDELLVSPFLLLISAVEMVLTFLLGAIFFKKGKAGKTILAMMLLSIVMSVFFGAVFQGLDLDIENIVARIDSWGPYKLVSALNWMININLLFWYAILLGGLWFRLKNLKH